MKYDLTNLPAGMAWQRNGDVRGQRFWVEHAFHEAKGQLGMAQYRVRVWRGWHHHMSHCFLAMLFMLNQQAGTEKPIPLLGCRNLTELHDYYLPRRSATEEEVLRQLRKCRRMRQEDIERRSPPKWLIF